MEVKCVGSTSVGEELTFTIEVRLTDAEARQLRNKGVGYTSAFLELGTNNFPGKMSFAGLSYAYPILITLHGATAWGLNLLNKQAAAAWVRGRLEAFLLAE